MRHDPPRVVTLDLGVEASGLPDLAVESSIHRNLRQDIIITTKDRIRICLMNHLQTMERSREWITPFGILLTLVLTLITTTPRDFVLKKDVWEGAFIVAGVVVVVWLVQTIRYAFMRSSLDDVIREIQVETNNLADLQEQATVEQVPKKTFLESMFGTRRR